MLYAAGDLTDEGVSAPNGFFTYVTKWDGSGWSKAGGDLCSTYYPPYAIQGLVCDPRNNIYAAGLLEDTTVTDTAIAPPHDTTFRHPYYVARYGDGGLTVPAISQYTAADIYPNPANEHLCIRLHGQPAAGQLPYYDLYNCLGQALMSGVLQGSVTEIETATLPPGIYVLKLGGTVNEAYKVMKE